MIFSANGPDGTRLDSSRLEVSNIQDLLFRETLKSVYFIAACALPTAVSVSQRRVFCTDSILQQKEPLCHDRLVAHQRNSEVFIHNGLNGKEEVECTMPSRDDAEPTI